MLLKKIDLIDNQFKNLIKKELPTFQKINLLYSIIINKWLIHQIK